MNAAPRAPLPAESRHRLVGKSLRAAAWLVAAFEDRSADKTLREHALSELRAPLDELGLLVEYERPDGALRLPRLHADSPPEQRSA